MSRNIGESWPSPTHRGVTSTPDRKERDIKGRETFEDVVVGTREVTEGTRRSPSDPRRGKSRRHRSQTVSCLWVVLRRTLPPEGRRRPVHPGRRRVRSRRHLPSHLTTRLRLRPEDLEHWGLGSPGRGNGGGSYNRPGDPLKVGVRPHSVSGEPRSRGDLPSKHRCPSRPAEVKLESVYLRQIAKCCEEQRKR